MGNNKVKVAAVIVFPDTLCDRMQEEEKRLTRPRRALDKLEKAPLLRRVHVDLLQQRQPRKEKQNT